MADVDKEQLVVATANRLRMVQADLADETEEVRQQYLLDEVERSVQKLVPSDRAWFLDKLRERFPTWDAQQTAKSLAAGDEQATRSGVDEAELNDPGFLLERLGQVVRRLDDREREGVARRVRDLGLAAEGGAPWPEQPAEQVARALKMSEETSLDPVRSVETLAKLAEFVVSLDQLMWGVWRGIAPKSDVRAQGEAVEALRKYLSGDPDTSRGEVTHAVERLRALTAALVSALSKAGQQFALSHHQKFSPASIEEWAKQDKGVLSSSSSACWKKYREIYGGSDEATIERELMDLIAEYAEKLMKGLNR